MHACSFRKYAGGLLHTCVVIYVCVCICMHVHFAGNLREDYCAHVVDTHSCMYVRKCVCFKHKHTHSHRVCLKHTHTHTHTHTERNISTCTQVLTGNLAATLEHHPQKTMHACMEGIRIQVSLGCPFAWQRMSLCTLSNASLILDLSLYHPTVERCIYMYMYV